MGHINWPPKLLRTEVLGEVKDVSKRKITRDIGRACYLGGNTYYAFGDTFCHDARGEFVGVTHSTVALVPDPIGAPTRSDYIDESARVKAFVPYTEGEEAWTNQPEHRDKNDRVVLWSFGGVVEDREGCGTGWIFYDKQLTHGAELGRHFGTSVARVSVQPNGMLKVERPLGETMVFGEGEPRFGGTSFLCDDDGWVYLMGWHDPAPKQLDLRCHLTRIRRDDDFTNRDNYEFWINTLDGKGAWDKNYNHVDDLKKLGDLDVQQHGALFKAPEFAPEGRPYLWIGNNKFLVGHFYMGCAPDITGPWEVHDLGELPRDPNPHDGHSSGPKYCLYPNPRASDLARGEVLCTWTDAAQLGGKVIAAKFWLEGQYDAPPRHATAGSDHDKETSAFGGRLKDKLRDLLKR